ncbi:MAG: hypothetical protein M1829_001993 [Trizodia sp. TS-e1964]|nr:MAG: hypothetical protein M1829_001993 [Trizodia sp. TS-e1964]
MNEALTSILCAKSAGSFVTSPNPSASKQTVPGNVTMVLYRAVVSHRPRALMAHSPPTPPVALNASARSPQLLGQPNIEITLERKLSPGIPKEYGKHLIEEVLCDAVFRPKCFCIRIEKGDFIEQGAVRYKGIGLDRYSLRFLFDKSPCPPREEWQKPECRPDGKDFGTIQRNGGSYFLAHVAGVSKEEEQDDIDLALARLNTLVPEDQQRSRITEFAEHLHVFFFSALRAGGSATREPSAALSPDPTVQRIRRRKSPAKPQRPYLPPRTPPVRGGRRMAPTPKTTTISFFTSFEDFDRMPVEAAHIIPHSIGARSGKNEMLNDSQLAALHLLDMFDSTAMALIDGAGIDTPKNAILLSKNWRHFFGTFQVYFDKADNQANTYTVCVANPNESIRSLPRTVTFQWESIELPSPHLLALHKAVAKIMYLTGAGECTDHIDRYDSAETIAADGSTNLAILLNLRLFTSPIRAY